MFLFMHNVHPEPFIDNPVLFMIKYNPKYNRWKALKIL